MTVVGAIWFTAAYGTVGIVRTESKYDGRQYFIGPAKGIDEEQDKELIADWGSRFPTDVGDKLFGVS